MQKNVTPGRHKSCPDYSPEFNQPLVAAPTGKPEQHAEDLQPLSISGEITFIPAVQRPLRQTPTRKPFS